MGCLQTVHSIKLIELELVQVTGRAELPGRPIQYGTTEKFLEFTGIRELDELPASDVLSNHQIDDWMRKSEEPEEDISDEDVGLAKEPNPDELPLDQEFAEIDWQKENAESDAAGDVVEFEDYTPSAIITCPKTSTPSFSVTATRSMRSTNRSCNC